MLNLVPTYAQSTKWNCVVLVMLNLVPTYAQFVLNQMKLCWFCCVQLSAHLLLNSFSPKWNCVGFVVLNLVPTYAQFVLNQMKLCIGICVKLDFGGIIPALSVDWCLCFNGAGIFTPQAMILKQKVCYERYFSCIVAQQQTRHWSPQAFPSCMHGLCIIIIELECTLGHTQKIQQIFVTKTLGWGGYTQQGGALTIRPWGKEWVPQVEQQTSHNIDCALGPLCYKRACSIWIAWQCSPPMKGELRWRGANRISKFEHHKINGGAVSNTWRHR
jgi:hypothetical protein